VCLSALQEYVNADMRGVIIVSLCRYRSGATCVSVDDCYFLLMLYLKQIGIIIF